MSIAKQYSTLDDNIILIPIQKIIKTLNTTENALIKTIISLSKSNFEKYNTYIKYDIYEGEEVIIYTPWNPTCKIAELNWVFVN